MFILNSKHLVAKLYLILSGIFLVLYWSSISAILVAKYFHYTYYDLIDHKVLLERMLSIPITEIITYRHPIVFFVMAANFVLFPLLIFSNSKDRYRNVFVMMAVCFPIALFGLLSIIMSIIYDGFQHDGEWLWEHWPIYESYSLWWILLSLIGFYIYVKSIKRSGFNC